MSRMDRAGIGVEVPTGWEGSISGGEFQLLADGARQPTVMHLASFPLPVERGSFGSGAVEMMGSRDVFITLFEYGPDSVGTALFAAQGMPHDLQARQFDRHALQRALPGQSGLQQFFTHNGRAFCLYVVLGSHIDRVELLPAVNEVLETMEIR
ncbi:MAG TPA: hypothetical protein VIH55_07370 [Acidimicrobiia bacterium]